MINSQQCSFLKEKTVKLFVSARQNKRKFGHFHFKFILFNNFVKMTTQTLLYLILNF